ncbi:MAG: ATP-dependent Clp protease ATP-binding subunit [Phycisphaerales bacterium]|nr:ATP-dependent Clp protease ATP-binding subunit [Phycisphaerales bacterium]
MPAYRFPILLFQGPAGGHTATLVEDNGGIAALGATPAEARDRLRDYLERTYRNFPWYERPDFEEPQLSFQRIDVRAQYTAAGRTYPCGETIPLRVAVVTGHTATGLLVAAIPTLGIRFNYYSRDDLKPLVTQYVQAHVRDHTPAQVARYLPPAAMELDDIVIQVPREPRERIEETDLEDLAAVADPLAARELRTRYPRAWERDELIGRLVEALRRESAPILLLGESGVGKTSILADAARRIERAADPADSVSPPADADAPATRRGKRVNRFWLTSAPRLIAGMQYLGMWQERVESIVTQTAGIAGILCAENLLDLVRTGGRSPGDSIGAFLMPYLQRSELRLIAEATPAELDAIRRLLPGLADLFQIITVPPFSRAQAVNCLNQMAAAHRQNLKVDAERGLVETVYRLFARFMPYHPFPGKAPAFVADLFDRAAREQHERASPADAIALFVRQTGVPELFLRDELPLDIEQVVRTLHREVIGQERACRAAAGVVTTFKAGLNDPERPLGVLLFAGPTGVGKTQLAQSLARFLYGGGTADGARPSAQRLVRLDMSEYAGADAAERFLGSPHTGPADWIQKIRQQPFTVLLLDEIEKAAPAIFDILLGVFDEGRLTDPWGRLTHFKSAVIIMTSNLGSAAGDAFGLSKTHAPAYESETMGFFRPEFFNRIDAVVAFDPLTPETIRAIAEKELRDLAQREGLTRAGLRLRWTPALLDLLSHEGFDPRYGARPLQRAIEMLVVTPLSKYLVDHRKRDTTIMIDVDSGGRVTIAPSGD